MNKLRILFYATSFLLAGCNNNKTEVPEMTVADSLKKANLIYTSQLADLNGKRNIAELLCQGWELEDDLEAITNNNAARGIVPFRSFYFFADSSFVKNPRNALDYGRWSYDDGAKTITLYYQDGGRDLYKIVAINATELLVINKAVESDTQLKFVSKGKCYKNKMQDPYYIANNRWRIAPKKSEPDPLINQRLKDCIHFYILFYKDNLAREEKQISFYGFPTCIKWYAGGIFMLKEEDLDKNWFDCFYNKDEAMKAYKMMETIVAKKYQWPKENTMTWVKKNLIVLEQMYAKM